jgi:hypothetical protein
MIIVVRAMVSGFDGIAIALAVLFASVRVGRFDLPQKWRIGSKVALICMGKLSISF